MNQTGMSFRDGVDLPVLDLQRGISCGNGMKFVPYDAGGEKDPHDCWILQL
jgi:hypothetical protein